MRRSKSFVSMSTASLKMRGWKGRIVGKGIHGFLNGLLAMLKHKNKASQERTRFMELLTICDGCCGQLDFCYPRELEGRNSSVGIHRLVRNGNNLITVVLATGLLHGPLKCRL
jgi:hypothetical protein